LEGSKWYHLIGIGGIGMSALAHILVSNEHKVTGSDLKESEVTKRLQGMGIKIFFQHSPDNISPEIDIGVVSTAINDDNEELAQCRRLNIPVIHRGELLAQIFNPGKGIAVAGAHGKTTTTGMLAVTLEECNLSPTVLIGGDLPYFQGNAKQGTGELIIAEADESDGSFLKLQPHIGVITNIEDDHLDYYGTIDKVAEAFFQFCYSIAVRGIIIACSDDQQVKRLLCHLPNKLTYGLESGDLTAGNIKHQGLGLEAEIFYQDQKLGKLALNVPGRHNLLNSLAVVGVGIYLGLDMQEVFKGLSKFTGVKRRFQIISQTNKIKIVDDYAHHPTEIIATLKAARSVSPDNRVIAVFQPHRYSRTKSLFTQFANSFSDADIVIFDDIYSAGEKPIPEVNSQLIISQMKHPHVLYCEGRQEIISCLKELLKPKDLVITMGAGDIWRVAHQLANEL
jgi:UDP-N-acetylmuramate--alanine ligase